MNDHWVLCLVLWCAQLGLLWRPEPQSSEQLDKMLLLDNLFFPRFLCPCVGPKVYTGFRGACAPIRGRSCLIQQDDAKLYTYCKSLHSVCTSILLSILIFWALRLCKITAFVMFDPSLFSYSRPLQRWRWCIRTGCRWSQSVCRPDESAVSSPLNLSATVWEFSSNSSRQRTEASTGSPSTPWVCSHTQVNKTS